jgi:hypothetical protein
MGTIKGWFVQGEINAMITLKTLPKLPRRAPPPNPRETSERMNVNVIDKKQLI